MDQVIQRFGLREPQYFGLSFPADHLIGCCWLEFEKTLSHQFKCKFHHRFYLLSVYFFADQRTIDAFALQVQLVRSISILK